MAKYRKVDPETELTPQQELYCQEFIKNLGHGTNAHRVAYPANYSDKQRNEESSKLLSNPKVRQRIKFLRDQLAEVELCTREGLLQEMLEIVAEAKLDKKNDLRRKAVMDAAKMCGFITDKIEHKGGIVLDDKRKETVAAFLKRNKKP